MSIYEVVLNRSDGRYIETGVVLGPLGLFALIRTGPALRTGPLELAPATRIARNLTLASWRPGGPSTDGGSKETPKS